MEDRSEGRGGRGAPAWGGGERRCSEGPWLYTVDHRGLSVPLQASCVQYRLVVRDVNTLQVLQLYTCLDQIQHAEWSADSRFILCAMYKRGLVQVRCPQGPQP